ncbi:hypothetical protein [Allomuricauda sp. NBRC 101325]|uniref:hypothetical protein n=1 Tax=Allomuricauda sp. NBRC 101325 TaxID=1113758 RepID=UPI00255721DD|nr:hypothetical protein [Muricauda sp. NBRC 101325]
MAPESIEEPQSKIVYTKIEPEFVSQQFGDQFSFDVNNDNKDDFTIRSYYTGSAGYYDMEIIGTNESGSLSIASWWPYAIPLNVEQEISKLTYGQAVYQGWDYSGVASFLIEQCPEGEECSQIWNGKYLGLRLMVDGDIHYGWLQLDILSAKDWTVKDFAYNATPDMPINTGQKD